MRKRGKKILVSLATLGLVAAGSVSLNFYKGDVSLLKTSVLPTLQVIAEKTTKAPDLSIEEVVLKKVAEPTEEFNFYKYEVALTVKNNGGHLREGKVVVSAEPEQRDFVVKNSKSGFELGSGQSYVIENYRVFFDANYNGGEFDFAIEMLDGEDGDASNNVKTAAVFELEPQIKNLSVKQVGENGNLVLSFDADDYSLRKHEFQISTAEDFEFKEKDLGYGEINHEGAPYGYGKLKVGEDVESAFESRETSEAGAKNVQLKDEEKFVFIKATNPENGFYGLSEMLYFFPEEEMTRAQFAKFFVDYAGLEISEEGETFYHDVSDEEWYSPYLQTIFNLGLIDIDTHSFKPEEKITREEVMKIVMDYFDVDLVIGDGAPHFKDVKSDDLFYAYAESFYESHKASFLSEYLYPDKPASQTFLKQLINEYSKGN